MKKKEAKREVNITFDDTCVLDKLLPSSMLMCRAFCYELGLQGLSIEPMNEIKLDEVFRRLRLYLVSPLNGEYTIG